MTTTQTADKVFVLCRRCSGQGFIPAYSNVFHGECFACGGAKGKWEDPKAAGRREARREADRKRRAAKRAAAVGENDALWAEFAAQHPAEYALINLGRVNESNEEEDRDPRPEVALSYVYTFRRCDSQPEAAIRIIRDYARDKNIRHIPGPNGGIEINF